MPSAMSISPACSPVRSSEGLPSGKPPVQRSTCFEMIITSTRKKGGTGLDLSISRKLVELHGDYVTVESEVGKSSNFEITIPINAAPIKADSPKEATQ